ncbi:MAG TPA: redoxin domain-containing protein [Longimicrobiaceae bacterium]|nr:redoxin domain-containing protein [Longimicrobiaceae bacterium]
MEAYRDQYASVFNDGESVTLIGISTDDAQVLHDWAEEAEFPFLFASDPGAEVGQMYGAFRQLDDGRYLDNRTVFVIDPEGVIRYVAAPFREIDPTAYEELAAAIDAVVEGRNPAAEDGGQEGGTTEAD